MCFLVLFYIGKSFTTTNPSEIQKILERSKNSPRKTGRNRSTSPDASREALEKRRHSRKKSRSLSPPKKTTIIVEGLSFQKP